MSQTDEFRIFSQIEPEPSQAPPPPKQSETVKLRHLDKSTQSQIISAVARFVLFQGLSGQPIDKSKLKDAVPDNTKDLRVANAALDEARARLNIVGFDLKRAPDSILKKKGMPAKFKDRYYVVNIVKDDDEGSHRRELQGQNVDNSSEKGLLMIVLGLIYCKGEMRNQLRWLAEDVLYKMLHSLDENIPAEPDEKRKRTRLDMSSLSAARGSGVALTPNVDDAIERFVQMDYLIRDKVEQDNAAIENKIAYAMGPRAYLEVGQRQLIYFCAQATGSGEPDASMLAEIDDEGHKEEQD
jgi:hypothetical protein